MHGTNESWLNRLRATGAVQNEALADLRSILLFRVRRTFQGRAGVDESLAEDVAQEALIKTLGSLDQFQGKSRFTTWATTIAVRVALTELRRRRWKDVSLDQMDDGAGVAPSIAAAESEPHLESERNSLVEDMYRIIDTELTEKQRTALLAELQGMPMEEIGRRMGSNRNAIYKLTHDARRRLKKGLEAAGYTIGDLQTA
jgi:RNA polymerase sigma-70 factor (ECF subfamily)